ncbi:MAG TPA: ROK family protein, partial [Pseudonocardia sp.]|nr:ROK family protein [Pseudonocardia sp.]
DIGATKTLTVLRDERDAVLGEAVAPTPARHGGEAILDTAAGLVRDLLAGAGADARDLTGVGVGAAGVISRDGVVTAAGGSFTDWVGTEIDLGLSGRLGGVPVYSANDVKAFLLAELAELGVDSPRQALAVALGTGVGGALLVDGQLLSGGGAGAGEIGHVGDYGDAPCSCGRHGHVEAYAGGWALARRYTAETGRHLSTAEVAEAARSGDPVAVALFEQAGRCLGEAIAHTCGLLSIDLVILGGGLLRAWPLLERPLLDTLHQHPPLSCGPVQVRLTQLGDRAVALGAAGLVARSA